MSILPSKFVAETVDIRWEFLGEMPFGETVSSAVITVSVVSGVDSNPSGLLTGANVITGTEVKRKITAGVLGVIYNLSCLATSNTGRTYQLSHTLAVTPNTGSTVPFGPLTLTGILPPAYLGVTYNETLQIAGGIPPYVDVDIIAGAMPPWMIVSIAGDLLVFTGFPTAIGAYSFTPQVTDWGGYTAIDPQVGFEVTQPPPIYNDAFILQNNTQGGSVPPIRILYSADGVDWSGSWQGVAGTPPQLAFGLSAGVRALTFTQALAITNSADMGSTWQNSTGSPAPSACNRGGYSSVTGTIIIPNSSGGGAMIRSTDDGATFATVPGSPGGASPVYKGTSWFLYDGSLKRSDDDGLNWTASLGPFTTFSNSPGYDVTTDGTIIAIGSAVTGTNAPGVAETTDGTSFIYPVMPVGLSAVGCIMRMAYGRGVFVAVLNTGEIIYRLPDGVWRKSADTVGSNQPEGLIFTGAVFVVFSGDTLVGPLGIIKTSSDGNVWTTRRSETINSERWRQIFCPR